MSIDAINLLRRDASVLKLYAEMNQVLENLPAPATKEAR